MGKLISVTFFFENCEMFSIDGRYFGNFYVGDISTSYQRVAVNSIQEMNTANTIVMEIFSEGNGTYSCWGKWDTKFHRIMTYDDITEIAFEIEEPIDNKTAKTIKKSYYVNWKSDDWNNENNRNQLTQKSSLGNLYIVISSSPQKTWDEMFEEYDINDRELIEYTKQAYGFVYKNEHREEEDND